MPAVVIPGRPVPKGRPRMAYATRCAITGRKPTAQDPLEADHIIPIADGGTDDLWNLRAVLRSVNRQRGRGSSTGGHPLPRENQDVTR